MNHKRYNYNVILIQPEYVVIEDMCNIKGGMSITNAAEEVVDEVLKNHLINNRRIFYIDTDGFESELQHNGKEFTGFYDATHQDIQKDDKSMIVILDDDDERHDWFKKQFLNAHHFKDANECIEFICKNHKEIRVIFLDHDLADFGNNVIETEYGNKEITGWDVVRAMAKDSLCQDAQIIIHSLNPDGADRMHTTLRNCGYIYAEKCPFTTLRLVLKVNDQFS